MTRAAPRRRGCPGPTTRCRAAAGRPTPRGGALAATPTARSLSCERYSILPYSHQLRTALPCCNLPLSACARTCRALPGCGLQGSLPPQLASLPHLQTIDLSHNRLSGGIPKAWTTIGSLPALQTLQLGAAWAGRAGSLRQTHSAVAAAAWPLAVCRAQVPSSLPRLHPTFCWGCCSSPCVQPTTAWWAASPTSPQSAPVRRGRGAAHLQTHRCWLPACMELRKRTRCSAPAAALVHARRPASAGQTKPIRCTCRLHLIPVLQHLSQPPEPIHRAARLVLQDACAAGPFLQQHLQ